MINIQNDLYINIDINDDEILILNQKIREIYTEWLIKNKIRRELLINYNTNNIDDTINLFKNLESYDKSFKIKYLKYKNKYNQLKNSNNLI